MLSVYPILICKMLRFWDHINFRLQRGLKKVSKPLRKGTKKTKVPKHLQNSGSFIPRSHIKANVFNIYCLTLYICYIVSMRHEILYTQEVTLSHSASPHVTLLPWGCTKSMPHRKPCKKCFVISWKYFNVIFWNIITKTSQLNAHISFL
jgi:hypothetical protein